MIGKKTLVALFKIKKPHWDVERSREIENNSVIVELFPDSVSAFGSRTEAENQCSSPKQRVMGCLKEKDNSVKIMDSTQSHWKF